MFRKIVAVWVSLAMLFGFVVFVDIVTDIASPVKAATLYVNETGSGGAYTSIQDAINAANPGDTVFVYSGIYYENVIVNKTINLTGENKDSVTINGGGNEDVVHITANGVNITGFTITNSGIHSFPIDSGVDLDNVRNCKVYDNNISNNQYGIYLYNCSQNNISGNIISTHKEHSIYIRISEQNEIVSNYGSDNQCYIQIRESKSNDIIGNIGVNLSISYSSDIHVKNNTMISSGIFIEGDLIEHWNTHEIDTFNTVNGKPVYYWKNQSSGVIPAGAGEVILANCTNISIENQELTGGYVGLELGYSSNNNVINCNLSSNIYGAYLWRSNENNLTSNKASYTGISIRLILSNNNIIFDNNITNSFRGLMVSSSIGNNISSNEIKSHAYEGISLLNCSENFFTGNNVSDSGTWSWNSMFLAYSKSNNINNNTFFANPLYALSFEYSDENNVTNNKFHSNGWGLYIYISFRNNIISNNVSNNSGGIYLNFGYTSNIMGNNISSNTGYGMYIYKGSDNNVFDNNISFNGLGGIQIKSTLNNICNNTILSNNLSGINLNYTTFPDENNITHNKILYNDHGIYISKSNANNIFKNNISHNNYHGLFLEDADENIISDNTVFSNNLSGIYLQHSESNVIIENNISINLYGFNLQNSTNNSIYHNNIIVNTNQAYDYPAVNLWNDSYPSGGNYWSDYTGNDSYKGPNQDIPGSDEIGDTPYVIDADSKDNYPLMNPYKTKPFEHYITLYPGWNLISTPLIQDNQDLFKVLEMIDGYYDAVQWHDLTNLSDPWKHHRVGKPFGNDLFHLNESMGFWIHITQPGDTIFLYNGTQPVVNQSITLNPGWNMVGYPSLINRTRDNALNNINYGTEVDAIWTFNAATQTWQEIGPSDYFELGRGYWIHSKVMKVWDVPL